MRRLSSLFTLLLFHVVAMFCSSSFGLALYEAVDQSNDAIQITAKDSSILVSVCSTKLGGNI